MDLVAGGMQLSCKHHQHNNGDDIEAHTLTNNRHCNGEISFCVSKKGFANWEVLFLFRFFGSFFLSVFWFEGLLFRNRFPISDLGLDAGLRGNFSFVLLPAVYLLLIQFLNSPFLLLLLMDVFCFRAFGVLLSCSVVFTCGRFCCFFLRPRRLFLASAAGLTDLPTKLFASHLQSVDFIRRTFLSKASHFPICWILLSDISPNEQLFCFVWAVEIVLPFFFLFFLSWFVFFIPFATKIKLIWFLLLSWAQPPRHRDGQQDCAWPKWKKTAICISGWQIKFLYQICICLSSDYLLVVFFRFVPPPPPPPRCRVTSWVALSINQTQSKSISRLTPFLILGKSFEWNLLSVCENTIVCVFRFLDWSDI